MRVFITGYKGFIGKNLSSFLKNQGYSVDGYEFSLNEFPRIENYDVVVHLGAISSTTETDVEKILAQNLDFSIALLNECNKHRVKFQYSSSASVYGSSDNFKEDSDLSPKSPYAWSKFLFDRHVTQNISNFDCVVQGFRYFNVYGNSENHKGIQASPITQFRNQARTTGQIKIFENSENYLRDFVCVEDVCQIHKLFFDNNTSGIWNVGTGSPISFADIANIIAKKENAEILKIPMPDNLVNQYQKYTCADLTNLNKIIKIKKWISVEEWINSQY